MATWVLPSQLLLIALCSWNVLCFPAKKGWSQHDPYEGSLPNMEVRAAPALFSRLSYPAVEDVVYSSPGAYPASSSLSLDMSSEASWSAPPVWDPVEESAAASRNSMPTPYIGPPPFFQAGELNHYETNLEHGNTDRETEELNFPAPPPQQPQPLPYPGYQAGELSRYTSDLEHGNGEWETVEQGYMPPPPYASAPQGVEVSAASTSFPAQPVPLALTPVGWSQYYLFLTGQLPSGTYTHF
ncbi:uncharacterized protein LOC116376757 [Anarrhichthys ocellatus]|uniref:uncharacterized protein LOC116376757 n=1 Tax=Anarrhichthys ocellatus TaxID=433405 RepID=UPI0012EE9CB4|nr:uncharacterized protein LOC116376757 [Anarrhichthys ocellatus]